MSPAFHLQRGCSSQMKSEDAVLLSEMKYKSIFSPFFFLYMEQSPVSPHSPHLTPTPPIGLALLEGMTCWITLDILDLSYLRNIGQANSEFMSVICFGVMELISLSYIPSSSVTVNLDQTQLSEYILLPVYDLKQNCLEIWRIGSRWWLTFTEQTTIFWWLSSTNKKYS